MARATVTEVRVILPTATQLTDPQISAAIDAASCTIDQILECADQLSAECLAKVEAYLAAHYAAATENTLSLSSETDACSGSKVAYGFKFGDGVKGTPFGQIANQMSGGCLAELDKSPAGMFSVGCA